jgi:shikimate dehydrogenase
MPRLGVLGWPVAHSRSPAMHNAALEALGLAPAWRYQLLPVPPELLAETARALPAAGFRGANVTIPHKQAALALAHTATPVAAAIGAANTLGFAQDGTITADNTDAPGLLAALPEPPRGRTALILGAGGSARAAAYALREAGAADVAVWNRTPQRAEALAARLGVRAVRAPVQADLLVNCTAIGLHDDDAALKDLPLEADDLSGYACVVDLVYRDGGTALLTAATLAGSTVVDGLEILVRQGALSLQGWTHRRAPIEVMRAAARAQRSPP